MSNSDDEDVPQLHPDTLAALNEFYQEREEREIKLKTVLEQNNSEIDQTVDFEEDWQLSQFWYDENTVTTLTRGAVNCTNDNDKIALISCPTLYNELVKIAGERQVKIFEFDKRFSIFGSNFIFYDYNTPQNIPKNLGGTFDLVICDPPFLSEECLTKTAITAKFLSKKRIVLCTGAVMSDLAKRLLNVEKCDFLPHHKNNLANEFWCYSNFNFDEYL